MPEDYEIRIKGHLDQGWSDWFAGLELAHLDGNETRLSGSLSDQATLHGLLERIRDLNLTLISVTSSGPSAREPGEGLSRHRSRCGQAVATPQDVEFGR